MVVIQPLTVVNENVKEHIWPYLFVVRNCGKVEMI